MGLKSYLGKNGIDCKCGHSDHQHTDKVGACNAKDTRHLIKKTERGVACNCHKYRPSVIALAFEL